ncbi:MAG: hypothetical protein HUU49_03685 [Candidatus Buchananbacteria bacterium]|nr:hypothetical protein [Candidatus Buchananbacteria bacterium]
MKNKIKKFFAFSCILVVGVLSVPANIFARTESTNYIIYADVFSSGGLATSSSDLYSLYDTIGEAMILSATSASTLYGLKAGFQEMYPDQYITLSIADTAIELGALSSSSAKTDSNTMVVDTNASNGFSVTVSGSTLTSGANTITAIGGTAAASTVGSEQFGINLVANTSPAIGLAPSGTAPIGSAAGQYAIANSFAFASGDTVASSGSAINQTTFTVSYLANISASTESGTYTTTLTYSATANF